MFLKLPTKLLLPYCSYDCLNIRHQKVFQPNATCRSILVMLRTSSHFMEQVVDCHRCTIRLPHRFVSLILIILSFVQRSISSAWLLDPPFYLKRFCCRFCVWILKLETHIKLSTIHWGKHTKHKKKCKESWVRKTKSNCSLKWAVAYWILLILRISTFCARYERRIESACQWRFWRPFKDVPEQLSGCFLCKTMRDKYCVK